MLFNILSLQRSIGHTTLVRGDFRDPKIKFISPSNSYVTKKKIDHRKKPMNDNFWKAK